MKVASILIVAAVALCAAGCAGLPGIPDADVPVYTQDKAVTLIDPFKIQIDKAYWTDSFDRDYSSSATPSAKFLVIEFVVTNLGSTAISWTQSKPPVFMLVNQKGLKYASVGQEINRDDLTAKIIYGQGNINPGMSIRGKKVFDLPQGEYLMQVSLGRHMGGWSFAEGITRFKWILNPSVN